MTIRMVEWKDNSNYNSNIELKNYQYIPIYIQKIILTCIVSNIFSNDIYILLFQQLYQLYQNYLITYQPPMLLTMTHTKCIYCQKKLENKIYSKLIDLHYGWNHCNNCDDLITKWYYHYIELNSILPFDYIDNIDIDINYYRTRTNSINKANINMFKKYIVYNNTTNKILVPIYWVENHQHYEKWISLINILYHTYSIKTINYRIPDNWSSYTKQCWEIYFNDMYQIINSLDKLPDKELIKYLT